MDKSDIVSTRYNDLLNNFPSKPVPCEKVTSVLNYISYRDSFTYSSTDYKNVDTIVKYLCEN